MEIEIFDDYDALSQRARSIIVNQIREKNNSLVCTSSGNTPKRTYELLIEDYRHDPELFSQIRILKLDEWGGIPMDSPQSCESYLQERLIKPLGITEDRYISFRSNPQDPNEECRRVQESLKSNAPIDLCVLGLGLNGHIAFNEPSSFLQPHCHVALLTKKSTEHTMTADMEKKPTFGLTLGMADILQSRKIIILINGSQKQTITRELLKGQISTNIPATMLWLHPKVTCLTDQTVLTRS